MISQSHAPRSDHLFDTLHALRDCFCVFVDVADFLELADAIDRAFNSTMRPTKFSALTKRSPRLISRSSFCFFEEEESGVGSVVAMTGSVVVGTGVSDVDVWSAAVSVVKDAGSSSMNFQW